MKIRKLHLVTWGAVLALSLGWIGVANAKTDEKATMTLFHAIPLGFGADSVDIYANKVMRINGAAPGAIQTFTVDRGTEEIDIYTHGVVPSPTTKPILSYPKVFLSHNYDVTFVAHLDKDSKPTISYFKNMTTGAGSKRSWLTVRHVAAAPEVDIRQNTSDLYKNLANGNERKKSLTLNTYSVDAVLAGTTTVAVPATSVTIKKDVNTILYIWGSAAKGNIQVKVQEVDTKKG